MTKKVLTIATGLLLSLSFVLESEAHPLAPSLLSLQYHSANSYDVTWKTPIQRVDDGRLSPVMPPVCRTVSAISTRVEDTALVQRWRMDCGEKGLAGQNIAVDGIAASRANVLLNVTMPGKNSIQKILTPQDSAYRIADIQTWFEVFNQYLSLGVSHLVAGLDHVLFVIGLTLLVGIKRQLVWTITSFTIGHSVTLSAATLGFVSFPQQYAEILIALTILVTYSAIARSSVASPLRNWSGAVALCFGLLHGLGFAGALSEVGLPHENIPLALLAFNIGIEIGQLALIGLLVIIMLLARRLQFAGSYHLARLSTYCAGILSGFWFWQRLLG